MSSLAEILKSPFNDQGIQNMNVFYDSCVFSLKVKKGSLYENIVLVEKLSFDYEEELIKRDRNSLLIHFGDSGQPAPFVSTTGNAFLGAFLDKRRKLVFLTGIRRMQSGKIIPVVYRYDINAHTTRPVFPGTADIAEFNLMPDPGVWVNDRQPRASFKDSRIVITFQKFANLIHYIHRITLDMRGDSAKLEDYKVYRYGQAHNVNVLDFDESRMILKYDQYYGILVPTGEDNLINLGDTITSLSVEPVIEDTPAGDDLTWLQELTAFGDDPH